MVFKKNSDLGSGNRKLSPLKLKEELYEKFLRAVGKFNEENDVEIDLTTARRMAIAFFSDRIIADDFEITQSVGKKE